MWPTRIGLRLNLGFRLLVVAAGVVAGSVLLAGGFLFGHIDLHLRPQKAACRAGDAASCLALGERYEAENSIFGGLSVAQQYYETGCDAGSERSCLKLARISAGSDALWSDAKQLKGFGRACNGSIAEACFELGRTYAVGYRIKRDYGRSLPAFQRGCDGGNVESCHWLGLSFANGWGVTPDADRAHALFVSACARGLDDACGRLR